MDERRRYFRITDDFQVRVLNPGAGSRRDDEGARALVTSIVRVRNRLPEVAEVLADLERRVSQLENAFVQKSVARPAELVPGVNISGCGVAFRSKEFIQPGQQLDLEMIFESGKVILIAHGRVVSSDLVPGSESFGHLVRVDLDHLHPDDEETLVQYVLQRQMYQIRSSRGVVEERGSSGR